MNADNRKTIVGLIETIHDAIAEIDRRRQGAELPADVAADLSSATAGLTCVAVDLFGMVREPEAALG